MEEITYLHCEDLYKNTWRKGYNSLRLLKGGNALSEEELYKKISEFFQATVYLIQIYLGNQGIYYNANTMIIKVGFRYCFIEEGDAYMVLNDVISSPKKYSKNSVIQCFWENFHIFETLDNKMARFSKNEK